MQEQTQPPVPLAMNQEAGPSQSTQQAAPRVTIDDSDDEPIEVRRTPQPATLPKPVERRAKRGAAKPPRPIRMMIGRPGFDVVAEFRDLPVTNMRWGTLMDMAPARRRQIGAGLLLERRERKTRGKQKGRADPMEVDAVDTKSDWKIPCMNFFTTAILKVDNKQYGVEKVMIDPGSVVNLASVEVLEKIHTPLFPVHDLTIRTATSALTRIRYTHENMSFTLMEQRKISLTSTNPINS